MTNSGKERHDNLHFRCHAISNKKPILLPHFHILEQAPGFAATPLPTSSHFLLLHFYILEQAPGFAATPLPTRSQFHYHTFTSAILPPTSSNEQPVLLPALPSHLCIFVPEATPATVAQVATIDRLCKFMTVLFDLLTICNFHHK